MTVAKARSIVEGLFLIHRELRSISLPSHVLVCVGVTSDFGEMINPLDDR